MKVRFVNTLILLGYILLALTACNDRHSNIGTSIRPDVDLLKAKEDIFKLQCQTIKVDSIYSRSVYSLLGEFNDPLYGTYKASYISRLQHAPGFEFKNQPINGKIDSTFIVIDYSSWVGDSTIWSKVTAYQVMQELPESNYSTDLKKYIKDAKKLGTVAYQAGNSDGMHTIRIPVDNELGQKFLEASQKHPEYFENRDAFEDNLIRGIFLESTTGSGCIISVYSTALSMQYRYEKTGKTSDNKSDSTWIVTDYETFVNTRQLYMHRNFEEKNITNLLDPDKNFAYITGPEGVALSLTLPKESIKYLLANDNDKQNNINRMINGASLELEVDIPNNNSSILQPPAYLLLLPRDSVNNFFEGSHTELTRPESAFLSNQYNVNLRKYTFGNISLLLYKHLIDSQEKEKKELALTDLELIVLPVYRETNQNTTATLSNYIFPSAAKIKLKDGGIDLKVVSTAYKR